jgi:lipopolysaccharide/colanic/teichoic acid biosynthesis glycosyltransferase
VALASDYPFNDVEGGFMESAEANRLPEAVGSQTGAKRLLDVTLALILIVLFVPVFLLFGLLIKLDSPGPVFFRQPRVGYQGRVFTIYKFRTMYHDEADILGAQLTLDKDPRVTPFGEWLRKWSLDELPQIRNVLEGDMSLVGPRPHPLQAKAGDCLYQDAVPGYNRRHEVLPGITGWAQVNGWRGETAAVYQIEQRVHYDLEYIRRQSFWFDLRILALTCVCVVRNKAF